MDHPVELSPHGEGFAFMALAALGGARHKAGNRCQGALHQLQDLPCNILLRRPGQPVAVAFFKIEIRKSIIRKKAL